MFITEYDHGQPCWAELVTSDPAGSVKFYGELFGWDLVEEHAAEVASPGVFTMDGAPVVGVNLVAQPGPAEWTAYFNVDDLDVAVKAVVSSGGSVVVPPMQIDAAGTMALFADDAGAKFAAWQRGEFIGATRRSEPRAYIAHELGTSDYDSAKTFYSQVLGWEFTGNDLYGEACIKGRFVCGIMTDEGLAAYGRPKRADSWLAYFGAADVADTFNKAIELGATVVLPTKDNGREQEYAILTDPQGCTFGLNTR